MMANKDFYVRYRIYSQVAQRADTNYPSRAKRSLNNLHKAIVDDVDFWDRDYRNERMFQRTFIPSNNENINPKLSPFISAMALYFNCIVIWEEKLIFGNYQIIKTFQVIGYDIDCKLALHHIGKVINNINTMRDNLRINARRLKINARRADKKPNPINAHAYSSKKYYEAISLLNEVAKEILRHKPVYTKNREKDTNILKFIMEHKKLNFKKYSGESKFYHSFCRTGKFVNHRIIMVF